MRTNLSDVAKAFIAKGHPGYAMLTVVMIALVLMVTAVASVVGLAKASDAVSAIRGKPPPTVGNRARLLEGRE